MSRATAKFGNRRYFFIKDVNTGLYRSGTKGYSVPRLYAVTPENFDEAHEVRIYVDLVPKDAKIENFAVAKLNNR